MTKEEIQNKIEELEQELYEVSALADMYNVFQMGLKILVNSAYGSLSMQSTVFAGDKEYFSGAVTSSSRIANLIAGQANSKKIDEICGIEAVEVQYGRKSYLDHIPQQDTDSNYISIEPVIIKKFGPTYRETLTRKRLTEFTVNYINKISLPTTYDALENIFSKTLNAYLPEKLVEDPEVICDNFISLVPKMYFARKWWDEGLTLTKSKLKVTGLSMVRSNTPTFFRQELEKAMEILIDGNVEKVISYIEKVRAETATKKPKEIAINQGVTSLDYDWIEKDKKFKRWTGAKYLSAPVNSRACITHNLYIEDKKLPIKRIEPGDKISFIYMKVPNPLFSSSNAFGFKDPNVFDEKLDSYIDRNEMFEKGFLKSIKLITDPIKWDLTPKEDVFDDEEW